MVSILAALALPLSLHAQITFQRTYGGTADDGAQAVVQNEAGGYYVVGYTFSSGAGGADVSVTATDEYGTEQWSQLFGGQQDDYGFGVATTNGDGCLAAGYLVSMTQAEVALHANLADGGQHWIHVYGGTSNDMAYSVSRNSDDGFIVAGVTYSFGSGRPNAYVLRTDSVGDTLWTRTYGGANEDYAFAVQQSADSGFIICGTTYSYGAGQSDIYLIKTNAAGDTEWTRTYGGAEPEHGHSVQQTSDQGYVICGTTYSFGSGDADIWVVRTNANGDTLWTRTFGGDTADLGHCVAQTSDGGFIVCGQTASFGTGNYDAWLIRTDSSGDTLWARTSGGGDDDRAYSVRPTADGGFIVAGVTRSFGTGGSDAWLIKTDADGHVAIEEPKASATRPPAPAITCRPNPCRGTTTVSFAPQASTSPLTLRIYDIRGRVVLTRQVSTSSFLLSTSELPSGAYFVRCDIARERFTTRLILQR